MQVPITLVQVDTVSAAPDARAVDGHNQEASAAGLQVLAGRSPVFDLNGGSDQTLREQDSHLHRASTALAGPDAAAGDPRHGTPQQKAGTQPAGRPRRTRAQGAVTDLPDSKPSPQTGSESVPTTGGRRVSRGDFRGDGFQYETHAHALPWRTQLPESRRSRLLAALVDLETLCEVVMAAGALLAVGWFVTHDLGTVWRWCGGLVR